MHGKEIIIGALENPLYRWRTVEGIARDTGLPVDQVRQIICSPELEDNLLESSKSDKEGRSLFTTRDHYKRTAPVINRILSAISGEVI